MLADAIKKTVIQTIETALGRVRTSDKYADRTIDIDIIVYDGAVLEPSLWIRPFIAIPVAELLPGLESPNDGKRIRIVADEFLEKNAAILVNHPLE
jgi:7,8-dihydro-6-hydroxymethylpterin-pyrophosphokinase